MSRSTAAALRADVAIVHRGNGHVQIGCDPEQGFVVDLPTGVRSDDFVRFLRFLTVPRTAAEVSRAARGLGLRDEDARTLITHLRVSGASADTESSTSDPLRVRLHGRGPLTTRLAHLLRESGIPVVTSAQRPRVRQGDPSAPLAPWSESLVLLCDFLVHDPSVVSGLTRRRIPHMPVVVRDGVGIVGPLVLPGASSCLRCADHHRSDRDPGWPLITGQLVGRPGHASLAVTAATTALAAEQVEQIVTGLSDNELGRGSTPQVIDHTLEYRARPSRVRLRSWTPHPLCGCAFRS